MIRPRITLLIAVAAAATAAVGVSLSRADAPPGRYVLTAFSVTDTATGLIWERAPAATKYNPAQAANYCAYLVTPDSDAWRLPSMKEIQTLVDESRASPAIDLTAFPGAHSDWVWTGTFMAGTSTTWAVDFVRGEVPVATTAGSLPSTAYVRCVR